MATIDEIFNSMPEVAAEGDHEYLVIDPVNRTISVPESERIFAVVGDEVADRKYFLCPRYVGDGLDLAGMFLTVYFRNAGGDEDGCLVKDLAVVGDYVTFSWLLSEKVAAYKGAVQFGVCADLPNTAEKRRPDWNTTMASGEVLEGLHPALGDVEAETSDVVTQLREEIAASTAAVEAAGAAQVDVVEAAGAAATADAQAQIEAKGAATLATIPEDYTTLANKTNEQANAIKGSLSGEIVQASDVSPVEHYLGVKVRGKNRFYTANAITGTQYGITYTTADNSADILLDGTSTQEWAWTCENAIVLPAGTYMVSVFGLNTDETNGHDRLFIRYAATSEVLVNHVITGGAKSFTLEEAGEIRVYLVFKAGSSYTAAAVSIQIEEGTVATEYTPYIDLAGVTVTRCGKNLLNSEIMKEQATLNGVTITRDGDLLTFTGTLTTDSVLFSTSFFLHGVLGDYYTLSYKHIGGTVDGTASVCVGDCETAGAARQSWANIKMYDQDNHYTYQLLKPYIKDLWFYAMAGVTFTDYKIKIQLEPGKSATAHEDSAHATAMPDESGAVTSLPSLAPAMTLLTDTAGVTIECTYNRDSNAVYAELLAKIAALSGTN